MKFANYNAIKEKITKFVERINLLKYPGYEKDLEYLRGLCDYYRRTMSPKAEELILNDLRKFSKELKRREFFMVLNKDIIFRKIMYIKKLNKKIGFPAKDEDLQVLLRDYVAFAWKHYDEVEIDSDIVMTLRLFNERVARFNNIINPVLVNERSR